MKIGIIPGWLLAVVIAVEIGDYPGDLSLAVGAVCIGLSVAALARNQRALMPVIAPVGVLIMRYMVLPSLATVATPDTGSVFFEAVLTSPVVLIVTSVLSIIASYLLGMQWAYQAAD